MQITIVYPAYNEEKNIRSTLDRSLAALRARFESFEILLINDKSADATGEIADEYAAANPEIRVIHNRVNQGQGASLRVGFAEARGELLLHNAMDYPFDLVDLDKMLPLMEDADIVVAIRKERTGYTAYRKLTSVVNVALLNLLFPLKLRDYNFVQLYRTSVLRSLDVSTRSTAFLAPELLIRAFDGGYRIRDVDIDYYPRTHGVATSGNPRVIARSVRDMLTFWVKRAAERAGRAR
jgi:dolichol-phosphate mannosyltransferase